MLEEAFLGQFFVFGAGNAVVGVGMDADAPARGEQSCHLNIFGLHQPDEVFHDDVDTVLMKIPMVAETEKI